ncbi:MAG: ROK family protein [Bacteroidales bacterium]|jgi:glucokinase|nr:ROK family protein [Bacteroidales bacterium]
MAPGELAVGIDIGGTNSVFGFVDRKGKILASGSIRTASFPRFENFVSVLYKEIIKTGNKSCKGLKIRGFGIGAPMGNINKGTIEHSAGLPWKGIVPLSDVFHRHTDLPVIVTNDANAAAVGEMIYGGAKGMKNFVVITLGTGLGSGFVADGRLLYGHTGFAGELGHTSLKPESSDRECGCGKKGCLETYVSATGLKRTLVKILADSMKPSRLRKYSFEELDSKIIYEAARKGDPLALLAFEKTGRILGYKLADVVAHTNPEAIFLFGGLARAGEMLFRPVRESMEENMLSIYRGKVKILGSKLNLQNAAVLGASSLVWSTC